MFEIIIPAVIALVIIISYVRFKSKKGSKNLVKKQDKKNTPSAHYKPDTVFKVVTVIDGDTYMLRTPQDTTFKVRVIGIDAPESHKSENKDIQYYGKEAAEYAQKVLLKKDVRIEYDAQPLDQYNRHLVYIYMNDNSMWNEHLVANGYAKAITFNPNVKYQTRLQKAERIAREKRMGLWKKEK